MNAKSKNYNRIVFFTTLSVYLGLVLVGATPPVLAHAALTKNFDVQTEIEVKDELDNKPENEEIENFFAIGLDTAIADFVEDLRELKRQGKYKFNFRKTFTSSCSHSFCSPEQGAASIVIERENDKIADALRELHAKIDFSDHNNFYKQLFAKYQAHDNDGKSCRQIDLKLAFSQKELNINVGFTKESAQKAFYFAENLNRAFIVKSGKATKRLTKQIYENTKATSENDQVFVVTRLPRGSIDSLLKQ